MNMVYPHEGQYRMLNMLLGSTSVSSTCYLRLFQNDITPDVDSVFSDFTTCTFNGYTTKSLSRGSWTIGRIGLLPTFCYYADQVWTCTATPSPAQYAYGYCISLSVAGYIIVACRFDVPVLITNGMDITVTPVIVLDDWAGA